MTTGLIFLRCSDTFALDRLYPDTNRLVRIGSRGSNPIFNGLENCLQIVTIIDLNDIPAEIT